MNERLRREALEKIRKTKELKRKIVKKTQKLVSDYKSSKISVAEYKRRLKKDFDGKTPQQWVDYYDGYLKVYNYHLKSSERKVKKPVVRNLVIILAVLGILALLVVFLVPKDLVLFAPGGPPTSITCEGSGCTGLILSDANSPFTIQASGSTGTSIEYHVEASLEGSETIQNNTPESKGGFLTGLTWIEDTTIPIWNEPAISYYNYQFWNEFTFLSSSPTIRVLSVYSFADPGNNPQVILGIYDDTGVDGAPGNLVAKTEPVTVGGIGWVGAEIDIPYHVSAPETFYIAAISDIEPTTKWNYFRSGGTSVTRYKIPQGSFELIGPTAGNTNPYDPYQFGRLRMGRADLQGEEDLTTDPTEYNNLGSDYKSIDFIDISVQIEDYGQAGSIALANTAPDLRIDISDGVGSWVSFDLDLSTVYTSPGQIITFRIDVNNDPLGIIRTHWLDADNQDIIVVGKNVDYYQSTQVYDIIDYTNFDVTIDGVKWTKIGDHDDTLSFDWDTTTITPQTDVDLRANSSDNLDEFSDYNTIPFDFAMEIVDTQSELTWNTGLLDLGGVFDGGHVEGSATVNALGIHTNVQVTRTSGEDWITPTDSDLGDMTDNQQPVMFNCNPPIPTPETTYSADFKVASVQDPLGEDITVSCDVQEAEDCGNQICEAGEDCGSCAVDCACANSGSCEVDFCFCPLDWGGKLCDIDLSPQVTIISVDSDNLVDFAKPGETNPVEIIFDVTDVDGVGDLDESSLAIDYDFSGEGEQSRTGDINDCTFQDNGNTRTYTCQIDMQFYDSPGSWTATVLIKDSILNQGQDTHFFTVNLLRAISLNQATISFPQVTPGDTDIFAQADTIITNKGNFDIPGDSKLQIISWDLIGQITSSEFIPGDNFMSIDESDSANVCSNGQQLSVGEGVEILNVLLPRGSQASPTSTRNIYHCLKTVPVGLSVQTYSTTTPWQIEVVLALAVLIPAIKKKKKKKRKKSKKLLESFNENAEELLEFYKEHETKLRDVEKLLKFYKKHKKQLEETPEFEEESESEEIKIPLEIFRQELSPAEVVCKYLKENKKLKFSEIAKLINRDQRTVWINYRNAIEKKKAKIKVKENLVVVSVGIFVNRKLSILESIVKHLREKGISNSRIAEMLNKSASNIWTLNSRATKKITNG